MRATKAIAILLVVGALAAAGVLAFFPSLRPTFVKKWFWASKGLKPAKTPEEAMEKFKQALEMREYEAAGTLYCTGEYKEFIDRSHKDAKLLADEIEALKATIKDRNMHSDKVDAALFWLTPFPTTFKYEVKKLGEDKYVAILDWRDSAKVAAVNLAEWKIDPNMINSLMPSSGLGLVQIPLRQVDGSWKLVIPVEASGLRGRHLRDSTEALRKKAGNYKAGLERVKIDLKTDAVTKGDLDTALKVVIEQSN
jgi:hypothetical protein